eukprot:TRINITY_DN115059_c0_g1_i1.p1 TRINITY_DN115059_c0_g1~~TRINITY_DN115059_c0_g1_i1.p1  ORF type:complete len:148 (-),score=17.62 TRINITY_DN115059_c0_g1_i1:158-601(-)
MVRKVLLLSLFFQASTKVAADFSSNSEDDLNCPCPYGVTPSVECTQCREIRCSVGGMALKRSTSAYPWAEKVRTKWAENCKSYAKFDPHISTQVMCSQVASPCVLACAGEDSQTSCLGTCADNLKYAAHACANFPWPVPFKNEPIFN